IPSISTSVFSGPMPRISIWRLLPRWPLVELPVRLTPGMVRMSSLISRAGGRFLISSAVMVETPGACRFCWAAVTMMVSPSGALVSLPSAWFEEDSADVLRVAALSGVENAVAPRPNPKSVAKEYRDNVLFIFVPGPVSIPEPLVCIGSIKREQRHQRDGRLSYGV